MPTLDFVVRGEGPAEERRDAQRRKELPGDPLGARIRRFSALGPQAERSAADRREPVERLLHRSPVEIHLGRSRTAAERDRSPRIVLEDDRQPVVLVKRETSQDDGVDHREDGRAGADAEGQDREGDEREGGRVAE